MNRDKKLNDLINRLNRIFPNLTLYKEGEYFESEIIKSGKRSDIDKMYNDSNYAPPVTLDWYDIIKELDKNGLEIRNK